ncbi:NUDIX hydrolase [Candidatus Kaiserbacteria bacterium]|nr:NUDIX hydrolase [Candidatus Kaiserbacteria bacterium]
MTNKIIHDSETPAHGQQVVTASAFIHHVFDGVEKVFLPKRAETKKFLPGFYELPGGHIDFGEGLEEGLAREIKEEMGMRINVGDPFTAFADINYVKGSHTVEIVYFATFLDPVENIVLHPEDHSGYVWAAEDEAMTLFDVSDEALKNVQRGFALLRGERIDVG